MRSLITNDDVFQKVLDQLAADNPCPDCGSTTEAEPVNSRNWRGVVVKCPKCKVMVTEIDEPERGWL